MARALRYRIRLDAPHTQRVAVALEASGVDADATLVMPAWTPGSYLLREYARNVVTFAATDGAGRPLPFEKTAKDRWRVAAPADGTLRAEWVLHAAELSVRTNHVDATHAFLTGAATFLCLEGREDDPAEVEVDAPEGWRVATALPEIGERRYRAADFDTLVDAPLEIGTHHEASWEVDGVPHAWAVWGEGNGDPARLIADTTRIVRAERALFGELPYPAFLFILHLGAGNGGLEHRDSTVLAADRWALRGRAYEAFLGLTAHELFHAWNGKRIRPAALGPFDYARENYTRDLWVVEGITTYYTELVLRRAGLISPERYLEKLGETITRYRAVPGRTVQPLADASFDAWIKFYRPDANSPNATVSYYLKGAMVALLLDLEIRRRTSNARTLDDVLRLLWTRWGARDVGFPEGAVEAVAAEVAGAELSEFFDVAIRGTGELDFDGPLAAAGLALVPRHDAAGRAAPGGPEAWTGMVLRASGGRLGVGQVLEGSPGWAAGVNAEDELVALDGFRVVDEKWLAARLLERPAGTTVALTVFRRDALRTLEMRVEHREPTALAVVRVAEAPGEAVALGEDWLRGVVEGAVGG